MTIEALIFRAKLAAKETSELCEELWATAGGVGAAQLDREKCLVLERQANQLACAATELQRRSAGVKPPPRGEQENTEATKEHEL